VVGISWLTGLAMTAKHRYTKAQRQGIAGAIATFCLGLALGGVIIWLVAGGPGAGSADKSPKADAERRADWEQARAWNGRSVAVAPWRSDVELRDAAGELVEDWTLSFGGWGLLGSKRNPHYFRAGLTELGTVVFRDGAAGATRDATTKPADGEPQDEKASPRYTRKDMTRIDGPNDADAADASGQGKSAATAATDPPGATEVLGQIIDQLKAALPGVIVTRTSKLSDSALAYVTTSAGMVTFVATREGPRRVSVAYTSVFLSRPLSENRLGDFQASLEE
jgi:hypothetical protein